ncbi:MAG: 4-phosphoerythronate dehydrogenase PdxB [Planctomycetes bacterium]|nr:4-phosphoerythronate dehydrogenase PdxB [Planctomycetota bacterium]
MKIIVDENIPYGLEAFGTLGAVERCAGREMCAGFVRDADALIVRSVTKVNEELLTGSRVRFVGTCTIGTDHVDLDYLREHEIGFSSAPGSNANSVGEYITAALLVLARRGGCRLEGKTIGVVGVGNVGTKVVQKAETLGMRVLLNDPPRQRETGEERFRPIEELFDTDFITVHVPLTKEGPDATYHLVDEHFLSSMKPGSVLLNSSRGPVADGGAVGRALDSGHLSAVLLDVWEGEPDIDVALLEKVAIGTPHIAGYSFDGKVLGTQMIYQALCQHLGVPTDWDPAPLLPEPEHPVLEIDAKGRDDEDVLRQAVLTVYDIEQDDADLRKMINLPSAERVAHFDSLRKNYPRRREFPKTRIALTGGEEKIGATLAALGFDVARR